MKDANSCQSRCQIMEDISNINSLVYYVSKISQKWKFSNPFFSILQSLLLDKPTTIEANVLRKTQEYHFIAKIIYDELKNNKSEIKKNCKDTSSLLEKYLNHKQEDDGEHTLKRLFYIIILKILDKNQHFNNFEQENVSEFLIKFQTKDNNSKLIQLILCTIYGIEKPAGNIIEPTDELSLSLQLFYYRLVLSREQKRTKSVLIKYYLLQSKLDKIELSLISSERSKGRLIEIAIILKATTGSGLYLPEIEKEQYLSSFTKEIFRKKYHSLISEANSVKIHNFSIPNWAVLGLFFAIEAFVFSLPNLTESISIGIISISTKQLSELPIWVILLANGLIVSLYIIVQRRNINKRISDEKWT
jgi:hypothetical protein